MSEYTEDFKQEVRNYFKEHSGAETMRNFNISRNTLYNWTDPSRAEQNRQFFREHYSRKTDKKKQIEKKKLLKEIKRQPNTILENILLKPHLHYEYPISECKEELEKVRKLGGNLLPRFYNKTILTFQPHFYEKEKNMWFLNENGLREWMVKNRKKYINKDEYQLTDKEILRGFKITGKHIGFSHFNPQWIKYFIEKYNVKSIYDPCGGWGHRLLGSENITYIYNDLDTRTYLGCKCVSDTFKLRNNTFYNNDSSKFTPKEKYEAVFTCPPYFNKEIYQNKSFKDENDFSIWWKKTIECSVKEGVKYFAFVISGDLLYITKKQIYFKLIEESVIGRKNNHFQHGTNVTANEILLVYEI